MSAEGNDFVATATAEKRLREVLSERLTVPADYMESVADALLEGAEITYLPRKRSVSILLRYPETAAPKPSNGKQLTEEQIEAGDGGSAEYGAPSEQGAVTVQPETPAEQRKRGARFGEFQPTVTSAPEYHEDDYFTE